jgi:nicotinamidase/pyrazinamidase
MQALIIVDVQNDFTTGGRLEVRHGEEIIEVINTLQAHFELIVATQDWHPASHKSFASNHAGKKPFDIIRLGDIEQVLWPDHCVQGTEGAAFHPGLDMNRVEAIFRKGVDPETDSYSGFYDNGHKRSTGLSGYLRERHVNSVCVCGLAADYCVFYTVKDAIREGFKTFLIEDATKPISTEGFEKARDEVKSLGGKVVRSSNFF